MNLNLRQLRAFVALAQTENFTRAAERMPMTQAGLSLMLREMETQLGCKLFGRTTRSVWLTEAGRRLLPLAERTLRDFDDVAGALGQLSAHAARTVRVAATPLVAASVLPAVCQDLAQSHPDVRVLVSDVDRREVHLLVEAGEVDVGLGILFKASPMLEHELLLRLPLVCVSARGTLSDRCSRSGGLSWSTLRGTPLIALQPDNAIQELVDAKLGQRHLSAHRQAFRNLQTLIAMAEAGRGAAILPGFVRTACSRYAVDVHAIEPATVLIDFVAVYRRGVEPTPACRPFLDALKGQLIVAR